MSINVEEILRKAEEEKEKALESVSVEKPVDLFVDLAHLAAFDPNLIDPKEFKYVWIWFSSFCIYFCLF